ELQERIKKESNIEGMENIKKAKNAIKRNEVSAAQKIVNEQDIKLSNNPDEALNDLNNLERETKKAQDRAANNVSYYRKVIRNERKNKKRVKHRRYGENQKSEKCNKTKRG